MTSNPADKTVGINRVAKATFLCLHTYLETNMSLFNKLSTIARGILGDNAQPKQADNFPGSLDELMAGSKTPSLRVSLGDTKTICKKDGTVPSVLRFGLGWTPAVSGTKIDLDASCSLVSYTGEISHAFFANKNLKGVRHLGDNLTGEGDGEDEKIIVNMDDISEQSANLYLTVHSYSGQLFNSVREVFCRVSDDTTGEVILEYPLSDVKSDGGILVAWVALNRSYPQFTAMKTKLPGRTVTDTKCKHILINHSITNQS